MAQTGPDSLINPETKKMIEPDSLDDLSPDEMAALSNFGADITPIEMNQLDEGFTTRERIHQQKLCKVALSSTSQTLKSLRLHSPDEFDAMLGMLDSFQEHTKGLAETSQKAYYRMLVIGCLSEDELRD